MCEFSFVLPRFRWLIDEHQTDILFPPASFNLNHHVPSGSLLACLRFLFFANSLLWVLFYFESSCLACKIVRHFVLFSFVISVVIIKYLILLINSFPLHLHHWKPVRQQALLNYLHAPILGILLAVYYSSGSRVVGLVVAGSAWWGPNGDGSGAGGYGDGDDIIE